MINTMKKAISNLQNPIQFSPFCTYTWQAKILFQVSVFQMTDETDLDEAILQAILTSMCITFPLKMW